MTPELQSTIESAINTQDSPQAIHVLGMIKKDPSLNVDHRVVWHLSYVRMNSLSPEQLLALMHESILAAYALPNFDLDFRIKDYLEQIDNVGEEIQFTQGLLKVIDTSDEVLGAQNITLKNNLVKPTIGNWIEDYVSFPSSAPEKDALTELEYMNKSPNVKVLSEPEKNILKNIIKLYDHAVDTVALYNSIEVPKTERELYKDYDLYKLIPGLEDDLAEEAEFKRTGIRPAPLNLSAVDGIQDAIPAPTAQPITQTFPPPVPQSSQIIPPVAPPVPQPAAPTSEQRRVIDDINRAQHKPVTYNGTDNSNSNSVSAGDAAKIYDAINHQPDQKRGVTMDPTNIKINEEQERFSQERAKQESEIQRKLAELRKRNNKPQ